MPEEFEEPVEEIVDQEDPVSEEVFDDEFCGTWYRPSLRERIVDWFKGALQYTAFGNIGNTRDFTEFEYKLMYKIIEMYSSYDNKITSWLFHYIDIKKFKLRWNTVSNGVGIQGSYNPALWRTLSLADNGWYDKSRPMCGVGGDQIGMVHKSTVNGIRYRVNTGIAGVMLQNFPIFIHELTHAFQFGLPCSMPAGSTWKDYVLFKVVLPIGYIFNRLVTLFIDNPLVDAILHKWDDITGKSSDYNYNSDKVHLPWLYKFTLEHDVDKEIEDNDRINDFCYKLGCAISTYEFYYNSDIYNPNCGINITKMTQEEITEYVERKREQLALATEEYGEAIMNMAIELHSMFIEEADKYIELDKQKSN